MVRAALNTCFILAALCVGTTCAIAQPGMEPIRKLQAVMNSFKQLKTFSYDFMVEAKYPDGTSEKMSGGIYRNEPGKILFTHNDLALSFSDSTWVYNADHTTKRVSVINKKRPSGGKTNIALQEYPDDLFAELIDSVIIKRAAIKSYRESNDTLYLSVDFPKMSMLPMTRLELQYNTRQQLPYSLQVYFAQDQEPDMNGKVNTIYQKYNCYNYSRKPRKYKAEDFFTLKNGKVNLRKYKDYKLTTAL